MHGLGNDFMVVDGVTQKIFFSPELIKRLSDRHFGVGFDQLLLVEPPYDPEVDFHYRIFNADGSEVQMCGNGARCFVRFVVDHGLTNKRDIKVSTVSGVLRLKLNNDDSVTVNMGVPQLEPEKLPFKADVQSESYELCVKGFDNVKIGAVSMGNPHAVINVKDVKTAPVHERGALVERHERFPERVNVGFSQKVNEHEINLRVFERGCGETLACGTGACASVVACFLNGYTDRKVFVNLLGGKLEISYDKNNNHVYLKGPARTVYEGEIDLD